MLRFCLLWALAVPVGAQVYKWVDEKGVTHYGERAPQGTKAREVEQHLANPAPAPGKAAEPDWKAKDLEFRSRRIESEQAETKKEQSETANRQACNLARDRLAAMKSARGMYRLNDKGERVYQSEDENRAAITQLERKVSENCR